MSNLASETDIRKKNPRAHSLDITTDEATAAKNEAPHLLCKTPSKDKSIVGSHDSSSMVLAFEQNSPMLLRNNGGAKTKREALVATEVTDCSQDGSPGYMFSHRISTDESCMPETSVDTPYAYRHKLLTLGQVEPFNGEISMRESSKSPERSIGSKSSAMVDMTRVPRFSDSTASGYGGSANKRSTTQVKKSSTHALCSMKAQKIRDRIGQKREQLMFSRKVALIERHLRDRDHPLAQL